MLMALDRGHVGAVSGRRGCCMCLHCKLWIHPHLYPHCKSRGGGRVLCVWMEERLLKDRCGSSIQCVPYRLHPSPVCANLWEGWEGAPYWPRQSRSSSPPIVRRVPSLSEIWKSTPSSSPPRPASASDRSPFVFSFSTTAINKHPVTISNCLSHREGGVGQIVMRDCKWYLSQILSCAWWMLTLCAHLKSHKGEKPKHCIVVWLFSSVNAQLHMWDLVTAMKHGKDEDGRPPGYQRESRKWM